jgi:pyruvate formate lyase activating enzyme
MTGYDGNVSGGILSIGHGTAKDGPGWRSIVYFKGCNFHCQWCASPQTIDARRSLLIYSNLEKYAERIAGACPRGAIYVADGHTHTDRRVCAACDAFECVSVCVDGSREIAGGETTVDEIISEVIQYKRFHKDYGITLSGGEPTCQWDFFIGLLKAARAHGLNTAVETNASSGRLLESLPFVDLFICDLKHADDAKHGELTGISNTMVLKNIKAIAEKGHPLWVRIPVVPGCNDCGNLDRTAEFLATVKNKELKVELLGYHRLGVHLWGALGLEYACATVKPPTEEELERARGMFRSRGIEVIST